MKSIGTDTRYLLLHLKAPRLAHTVYLYVPYDSNNKQRFFHYSALTDCSLYWTHTLLPVR